MGFAWAVDLAPAVVKGDLASGAFDLAAAGAVATGFAAVAGLCGGLVAVWASVDAAKVVTAPARTARTSCFMRANLSAGPLYCNKRRTS